MLHHIHHLDPCPQLRPDMSAAADKVELKTQSGSSVLHGTVVRIEVMRTIVRTDAGVPVAIPNKAVTEMIVSNESLSHPDRMQAAGVGTTPAVK